MRKVVAILLITVILFNIGGYKFWVSYIQDQHDISFQNSLNSANTIDEKDLIKISVPLQDAYQNDWSEYKRVDGEISFDGRIYKYVKEKVESGQLVLLCIPDHQKMKIESLKNDVLKGSLGMNNNKKENGKFTGKNIVDEFTIQQLHRFKFEQNIFDFTTKREHFNYSSSYHLSPEQPPDQQIV